MYRPQVRFDFEVHDNATTLAQKKERKERLNKLVTLLDHQEDLLLRSNAEDGEEEGEDMKEVDRGGSRPGVTLTNTTGPRGLSSTATPIKPTPPSSPSRKPVIISSSPKTTSASPLSRNHSTFTLPPIKITTATKNNAIEKHEDIKPGRINSGDSCNTETDTIFRSEVKPPDLASTRTPDSANMRSPDLASTRSDASRSGRRRVVSTGHIDTIKRLHQKLLEMEKEKQEKIDFIVDSQDSAQGALRATKFVGRIGDEKELRSARRHSSLSQKDQIRLAQLLNS